MPTPNSYNRPRKIEARARLLDGLKAAKCLVSLPGREALCIEEMMKRGIINTKTKQFWVEREPTYLPAMRGRAMALGLSPTIIKSKIENWVPERKFDLLNLDLEGSFSIRHGLWLERNARLIDEQAILLVTVKVQARNDEPDKFARWFLQRCETDATMRHVIETSIDGRLNHHRQELIYTIMMLACSLRQSNLGVMAPCFYKDGEPMLSLRVNLSRRVHENALPSLSDLSQEFEKVYTPKTYANRRAHVPRIRSRCEELPPPYQPRRNLHDDSPAKQRQRLAGYKSHLTRRRNQAAARLLAEAERVERVKESLLPHLILEQCETGFSLRTSSMLIGVYKTLDEIIPHFPTLHA